MTDGAGRRIGSLLAAAALMLCAAPSRAQGGASADQVAAILEALRSGMAALRKYEWVESTTLTHKGEPRATEQRRCHYDADGTLQKVPIPVEEPDEGDEKPPKEAMVKYMQEAVALIKRYAPPDPARIQAVQDAGKVSVLPLADRRHQVQFRDYLKAGDSLSIYVDPTTRRLLELRVATYLDKPKDAVTVDVALEQLGDGALYASEIVFMGVSKDLQVNVRNTGHRAGAG